jgi:outer membrane lipoprotein SlyB
MMGGEMSLMKNRMLGLILALLAAPALLCASDLPKPDLPVGTRVSVTLISTLSSRADRAGDIFTAQVQDPIFSKGMEVVPAGSKLRGHVTFVKPPGRVKGKAEMRLVADAIVLKDGHEYTLAGQLTDDAGSSVKVNGSEGTIQGKGKSKKQAAKESGIGAAAGAGVGALGAGGTGALYGAGIGAVAGLIHTLAKHHKDVVLQPGTELVFVLTSPGRIAKASQSKGTPVPFVCQSCK